MSNALKIQLKNVSAGPGNMPILHDIDWTIREGEHWVITGNMGSGKTLLCRCLTGSIRVFDGRVEYPFLGENSSYDRRRAAVKMVSFTDTSKLFHGVNAVHYYQQRYNAFDSDGHLTVAAYLEEGGFSRNSPEHMEVLERTGTLGLLDLERIKLSSGQTRKMLIAKAVLGGPAVLILDNPYMGLDVASRTIFNQLIDELAGEKDITIILSGHYESLPASITHRLHLWNGSVQAQGTLARVENALRQEGPLPLLNNQHLVKLKNYYLAGGSPPGFETVIRMQDVNLNYGRKVVLKDFNWTVRPGEKWALLGPNGSGKSTLLSLIYGDNPQAYAQEIFLFDRRRGTGESIWDIKRKIGFTSPELHAFFRYNYPALELVLSGLSDGLAIRRQPSADELTFVENLFLYFGLEDHLESRYRSLSTGMQRLLFFMRSLVRVPPLLLQDEPFQGFDDLTVIRCRHLLNELLTEHNTLIFITHYQKEIPTSVEKVLRL